MSLSIDIVRDLPDDQFAVEQTPYDIFDGVGTERLWTAPVIRDLGATFLPQLGGGFLWIRPGETGAFLRECAMLLAHSPRIVAATLENKTYPEQENYVERNLSTMIYVTYHARHNEHGVVIW
ncbi:hypothetical protein Ade02nite_71940 [Paractinoplanes deccanensis]|uniref:Uncharacterized protein n=1 Tax=Paractinoplanes deccanensis TaxID=113561 RepID=A0ABQ3YF03_9ACTN|nr:hypothetical protein [Actinoplanes deccanensis]GID78553.1 hypothetical protein Ade02nite_71940 [Actinoplanes deccanensis]